MVRDHYPFILNVIMGTEQNFMLSISVERLRGRREVDKGVKPSKVFFQIFQLAR